MKTRMWLFPMLLWLALNDRGSCQVLINEFMASNVLSAADEYGDYDDWIEIYSRDTAGVDLAGFCLSDNAAQPARWRFPSGQPAATTIPAKGHLVVWADSQPEQGPLHADFNLSRSHGSILLSGADGVTVLDRIDYGEQTPDISFGRYPDRASTLGFAIRPTLGGANAPNWPALSPAPGIVSPPGFYPSPVLVTLAPPPNGGTVFYTLDGSDPPAGSLAYTQPVSIGQTSVLRAGTMSPGLMAGPIASALYLVGAVHSLPVLSLVTNPANLSDPSIGIETNGTERGRAWERKSWMQYFEDKKLGFDEAAGLRIQGNTGRTMAKKSFRIFFRDGYGADALDFGLFGQSGINRFKTLVLRAGYDDGLSEPSGTLLRDPLASGLWRDLGNPSSRSRFCVLYVNGACRGIYDIREDVDIDFIRNYYQYADADVIRLRWPDDRTPDGWELDNGTADAWRDFMAFIDGHTFETDSMFAEAAKRMDIGNFTALMTLVQATQYRSWNYGAYVFRENRDGAKWQWAIWDMDRALIDVNYDEFTPPSGYPFWANRIAPKLLQNPSYRLTFINRLAGCLNTVFAPERVLSVLDSLAAAIESEIPAEASEWGGSLDTWKSDVEALRAFIRQRPDVVRGQAEKYFGLAGRAHVTVDADGGNGTVRINGMPLDHLPWTGVYFKGVPVSVTAVPAEGYRFEKWSDASLPQTDSVSLDLKCDRTVSAVFSRDAGIRAELIAPARIRSGRSFPVVVRLRDMDGRIQFTDQTPMSLTFEGAHPDTLIPIRRGAGTAAVRIVSESGFTMGAQNASAAAQKHVTISSVPVESVSGGLPAGDVVWDGTADRLVTSHLTVPAGCRLTIKQGTWILVKKNVNFYVRGEISVEGTADDPVVITSELWSEPWGGMEFTGGQAAFKYCMVLNGGGDASKGFPTDDGWHTGHQHIFYGKQDCVFSFDQCFFLYSPGKVFGVQDSRVTVSNSVSSFVWHGGEFHRVLLNYTDSHLMNLPNDDHIYTEDIDTDGFHIDYVNPKYPQYSVINRCYFVTGKDDAIDHHASRLKISNCWLEDFIHEGVAASGGDTVKIFNTISMKNDQGFEAGWTEDGYARGPHVFVDHCVAVENNVGLRIGDSYASSYRDFMKVTNSILFNNKDNIWNYLNSTHAPLAGALDISHSMANDDAYDGAPSCMTGVPEFDAVFRLKPGSPGTGRGTGGSDLGLCDSTSISAGSVVINEIMYREPDDWPSGDWVELLNPGPVPRDVSGWTLRDDDDGHVFRFPAGTVMPASGFLVVCVDTSDFEDLAPNTAGIIGNLDFGLGRGDAVRLYSAVNDLVDSVAYDTDSPWPSKPDGKGYSLELISPLLDNALPESWRASERYGGSAGKPNSGTNRIAADGANAPPAGFRLYQNYPNPFNPETRIRYALPAAARVTVTVLDLRGRVVETLADARQEAGMHEIAWRPERISSGMYICRMKAGNFVGMKKLIYQK